MLFRALFLLVLIAPARLFALFDGEFDDEPKCDCQPPVAPTGDATRPNSRWGLEAARIGFLSLSPVTSANLKNPGIGGRYDLSVRLPWFGFLNREHFEIRPGAFVGGLYHALGSQTGSGETGIVPGVIYFAVDFHKSWHRVIPYLALGAGATYFFLPSGAALGGTSYSQNLLAPTVFAAAGFKIYLGGARKWFLRLELSATDAVADSQIVLLQGNMGLGYRFGKRVWD